MWHSSPSGITPVAGFLALSQAPSQVLPGIAESYSTPPSRHSSHQASAYAATGLRLKFRDGQVCVIADAVRYGAAGLAAGESPAEPEITRLCFRHVYPEVNLAWPRLGHRKRAGGRAEGVRSDRVCKAESEVLTSVAASSPRQLRPTVLVLYSLGPLLPSVRLRAVSAVSCKTGKL